MDNFKKSLNELSPLAAAAYYGNRELLSQLILRGGSVNATYSCKYSPLYASCYAGHALIAGTLIEFGASMYEISKGSGMNPIQIACFNGRYETVVLLFLHGANFSMEMGWSPLYLAVYKGHTNIVMYLCSKGVDVNGGENDPETPLCLACHSCDVELVKLLISRGAKADTCNAEGVTPLMISILKKNVEISNILIEKGAPLNFRRGDGLTFDDLRNNDEYSDVCKKILKEEGAFSIYYAEDEISST